MMKKLFLICLFLLGLNANPINYKADITAKQAFKMLQNDKNILFLDIRTKYEYDKGHPKGSVLLPLFFLKNGQRVLNNNFIQEVYKASGNNLNRKIILICHSGSRTKYAAKALAKQGFTEVYNILYGYLARGGWMDSKIP
jgi:rhodanese-related sulfurtransferase